MIEYLEIFVQMWICMFVLMSYVYVFGFIMCLHFVYVQTCVFVHV